MSAKSYTLTCLQSNVSLNQVISLISGCKNLHAPAVRNNNVEESVVDFVTVSVITQ